jgi:3',5'-nucleoside bisphosphate phosphatase
MAGYADLHMHSRFSDGTLMPEELFKKASLIGLSAISITDHDTNEACLAARSLKDKYDVEFVDGIEFSCHDGDKEIHILAYYLDLENDHLNTILKQLKRARFERAERIVKKLHKHNVPLEFESVLERAGDAPLARPHIAIAMHNSGMVNTFKEAFIHYLAEGRPAYEPKVHFPVSEGIQLIKECGGISVLAHPWKAVSAETLYKTIEMGLDGIEVIHPLHDKEMQKYYHAIASQYWLIETGGSDYHGTRDFDDDNFGKFVVPYSVVESIKFHIGKK